MSHSKMHLICIVQARMGSKRLPGKTLMKVGDKKLIEHVLDRVLTAFDYPEVVLATTVNKEDNVLVDFVKTKYDGRIKVFRGDEVDVRSRFAAIAKKMGATYVLRITADDPFKDPFDLLLCKQLLLASKVDYCCNFSLGSIPLGMDVEGFSAEALYRSQDLDNTPEAREHVTKPLRELADFKRLHIEEFRGERTIRFTIDNQEDLDFCSCIASQLEDYNYSWKHTMNVLQLVTKVEIRAEKKK